MQKQLSDTQVDKVIASIGSARLNLKGDTQIQSIVWINTTLLD